MPDKPKHQPDGMSTPPERYRDMMGSLPRRPAPPKATELTTAPAQLRRHWVTPQMVAALTGLIVALGGGAYGGSVMTERDNPSSRQLERNTEQGSLISAKMDTISAEMDKFRSELKSSEVLTDISVIKAKNSSQDSQLGVLHGQMLWHASWICEENEGSPAKRHANFGPCNEHTWHEQPKGSTPHRYTNAVYPHQ